MNPWISIWTRVPETVKSARDTPWINYSGQIPFILLGVNGALGSKLVVALGNFDYGTLPILIILGCLGTLAGLLAGQIWTYVLLFFGKIWNGKGTKREIETVLSLSLIPETIKSIYLVGQIIVDDRSLVGIHVNGLLTIILFIS